MPSTQHTQACVFIKITVQNWYFLKNILFEHFGLFDGEKPRV